MDVAMTLIYGCICYAIGWYAGYVTGRIINKTQKVAVKDLYPSKDNK